MQLETTRLILRPFVSTDAADVQRLAGDIAVARMTLNVPHPYADGMAEQWIARQQDPEFQRTTLNFAIASRESGELCGCIGLRLNRPQSLADLGYWIGVAFWNQGLCTEAARAVTEHAFAELGLQRVQANHLSINPASGRVMQKIGMQFEGISRRAARRGDEFHDLARYGILRSDWLEQSGERSLKTD